MERRGVQGNRRMGRVAGFAAIGLVLASFTSSLRADGPADNDPSKVRQVPRPGIEVPPEVRAELEQGLEALETQLDKLRASKEPLHQQLLPDVEIFRRAVRVALTHNEFFAARDLEAGKRVLAEGQKRAASLLEGDAPWTGDTGLVVRGYVSELDDTVQPYGLVVPDTYARQGARHRLDIWFHGRGETLSEVNFIDQRMRSVGQYSPQDTIVLHPYGRYSNAFKFAGEVDVLEALDDVKRRYRVDEDRVSVRGFSMGGAACWQFAVHYPGRWFAANPGAGFSETPEFLRTFQNETLRPTRWERQLWHLYDCTDYAANLEACPTIAYSGELDVQKQAADIMAEAMAREGLDLLHVIGPGTKHSIHPDSKVIIEDKLQSLAARGRLRMPRRVRFVTYTLKYDQSHWVRIDELGQHWKRAEVNAAIRAPDAVAVATRNVEALTLDMPAGWCPLDIAQPIQVQIDGQTLSADRPKSDRSWSCQAYREAGQWKLGARPGDELRKKHNLQGPVDDAFMGRFLVVRPTGEPWHPEVGQWVRHELDHAVTQWRQHYRGDARVKEDRAVTDQDLADSNLVLFGDPGSNQVLRRILDQMPLDWTPQHLRMGRHTFDGESHAPILIFPNPLNPERYVVLNSGFTYREYAYLNNARQVPMLPDWAVVDLSVPPGTQYPGRIVAADFFDEQWRVRPSEDE